MSSDETYLEAFMETLSTLPHQVRRNMDLLRDLDSSCSTNGERLRHLHQEYIQQAEEKVMDLEIVYRQHNGETLQKSDEKVSIAQQTYEMVDVTVQRLERDLEAMEKLLQVCRRWKGLQFEIYLTSSRFNNYRLYLQSNGGFQTKVVGQVNELAACQPTPGSEWILGKILGYDNATGLYSVADEDTEINRGKRDDSTRDLPFKFGHK
jgi:hypothetical protein